MNFFQLITFILETIVMSATFLFVLLFALNIIKDKNTWLNSNNVLKRFIEIIIRIIIVALALIFSYSDLLPRFLDIIPLATGKISTISGHAFILKEEGKDLYQHISINDVQLDFFIDSGIKEFDRCKVSYLPNSHRAIAIEKYVEGTEDTYKKVGLPWQPVTGILYIFFSIIFLHKFAFKLLATASIIYYPLNIYFYITNGIANNAWYPSNNEALENIIFGISWLLLLALVYFIEKKIYPRFKHDFSSSDDLNYVIFTRSASPFIIYIYFLVTLKLFKML